MSTLHILLAAVILSPGLFWTTLLIMLYRRRREAYRAFYETARFFRELERRGA